MIPMPRKDARGKINGDFCPLQKAELIALHKAKLINNAAFVHFALRYENPYCDRPIEVIPKEFALRWSMPESSVYEAIAKLKNAELLPEWIVLKKANYGDTERRLRNRLHRKLGGLTEVATLSGRVDLLTETEIIEVKQIGGWKAALGQILIYSGFYHQHQKRLHLFGTAEELKALADIEAAVMSFGIKVTGEEV